MSSCLVKDLVAFRPLDMVYLTDGFDTGRWARLVGRHVGGKNRDEDIETMSELAVS
jgi:hypothetical protein